MEQLIDSAEEEMKYRFKPIRDREAFLVIIKEIASCVRSVDDLKTKIVQGVLKQSSGILKTLLELLIKRIESKQ